MTTSQPENEYCHICGELTCPMERDQRWSLCDYIEQLEKRATAEAKSKESEDYNDGNTAMVPTIQEPR